MRERERERERERIRRVMKNGSKETIIFLKGQKTVISKQCT